MELQEERQASCCSSEKPKSGPKPETECFYCKGNGHWKWNCRRYLADKKDGKVNKCIFDIHVIDVYFTSVDSNPSVFDTGSVAKSGNSKWELQNKHRLVKGEVMSELEVIPKVYPHGVSSCVLHHCQLCIFWHQYYEYVYYYDQDSINHQHWVYDHRRFYSCK